MEEHTLRRLYANCSLAYTPKTSSASPHRKALRQGGAAYAEIEVPSAETPEFSSDPGSVKVFGRSDCSFECFHLLPGIVPFEFNE